MSIDIPSNVILVPVGAKPEHAWEGLAHVCFRHAVGRALRGEEIMTRLVASANDYTLECIDCHQGDSRAREGQ